MYGVEVYATVRQLVFLEGLSRREVARRLGVSRDRVVQMCRNAAPSGYVRTKPVPRPKLDLSIGVPPTNSPCASCSIRCPAPASAAR